MEVRITVSGIGAGIPALSMGVNIISGCYIETKPNKGDAPTRLFAVVDTLSIGGESSTIFFGHAQTDWITVSLPASINALKFENILGKLVDIEIKGTSFGSGKGDVSLKIMNDIGNTETIIDKMDIGMKAYQLSSTKIRGKIKGNAIKKQLEKAK